MAAISSQQDLFDADKSAARALWERQARKHPGVAGFIGTINACLHFFIDGHAIVALGHWLVVTAGRIAETALLLATLWVTAANVAPDLVTGALGSPMVQMISGLALIAFSLLPEIIVFSAIVTSFQHWQKFFRDRRAANAEWLWGILYTLPTGMFIALTVITISSFVTSEGAVAHATGVALVARCLSGWFYSLVELVAASLGRRGTPPISQRQVEDQLAKLVAKTRTTLEDAVANAVANTERQLASQVATLNSQVATAVANEVATVVANGLVSSDQSLATGVATEQLEILVSLVQQQQEIISQLASQLADMRHEVHTSVTEIRSFSQSMPAVRPMRVLPAAKPSLAAERKPERLPDVGEERPAQRVLRFLEECNQRGYKPKLREIMETCQVAKATATGLRLSFYGSQNEED